MPSLIVFSHLRWNFVYQRPQHLLSRLAAHYHVVFIEEPVHDAGPPRLERCTPAANVEVLRPHTPVEASGFHDDQLPILKPLLAEHFASHGIDDYLAWLYTPMALPLLTDLAPRAIVYDCMDEMAGLKDAPRQMRQRESALLKCADLVLTAGPGLFEAKRTQHPKVLCLPSAVDAEHYANADAPTKVEAMQQAFALQGGIRGPRLGYFGVIDERVDLELLEALADADRTWQIVMVGPVVRLDQKRLPQRPNIHWMGHQPYDLLPQLVAGWDVCLVPFALNEATRFISPTKTLEYMAAGKPVVSTPIQDVKAMFSDVVRIGEDSTAFIAACHAALSEKGLHRTERLADMQACVWRYSWTETAEVVHKSIDSVLASRPFAAPRPAVATDLPDTMVARQAANAMPASGAPAVVPIATATSSSRDVALISQTAVATSSGQLAISAG